jgi:hypothetical protein
MAFCTGEPDMGQSVVSDQGACPMKQSEKPIAPAPQVAMSEKERKLDRRLDEALEETFPASDPIAVNPPDRDNGLQRKK